MADGGEDNDMNEKNSGGKVDGTPDVDLNSMFDQYLNEAASHPKYANREKERKENEQFMNNWEKEIERIPAFMSEIPKDLDAEENGLLAAFQAIKYDEDDPPEEQAMVHKDDGNQWFKKKKYKLAIKAYSEALKHEFDDDELRAVLYTNRAAAKFHLGNLRSSLNDAKEAVKHKPSHLKALVRAAECCMKLDEYGEAVTWCDNALKIVADDKRVLELRSSATKQQKIAGKNQRKRKAEEKTADSRKMKIVEAIKSRNIRFGKLRDKDPIKSQEQLVLDAVTKHPTGRCITLDESGNLSWPVTFLYPEHSQSDFIEVFHEDSIFSDHLQVLFEEPPPWDTPKMYRPHSVQVYFHHSEATRLVAVNHESTLRATLQDPRYLVAGDPHFVILPKGTPFTKSYLERFASLH